MRIGMLFNTAAWLALILVAACSPATGNQTTTTSEAQVGSDATVISETAAPVDETTIAPDAYPPASDAAYPAAQPAPDMAFSVTTEPGLVTVALDQDTYVVDKRITVIIANGLSQPIYTADMKSDCSIVILEGWDGSAWQPLPACGMKRVPLTITIPPGEGQMVVLDPLSSHFLLGGDGSEPAVGVGTYRISFTYRLEEGPEGEEPLEALSDSFEIVGAR